MKPFDLLEGFLTDKEQRTLLSLAKGKNLIVEIGAFKGKSTACLATNCNNVYSIDPHISDVEHFGESSFPLFCKNLQILGLFHRVHPIVKMSEDAVKDWTLPIDFLWIDGDHRYEAAKKDFDLWLPFVRKSGIVAFHDSTSDDVKQLVLEVKDQLKQIGLKHSISIFKNEPPTLLSKRFSLINRFEDFIRNLSLPPSLRTRLKALRP